MVVSWKKSVAVSKSPYVIVIASLNLVAIAVKQQSTNSFSNYCYSISAIAFLRSSSNQDTIKKNLDTSSIQSIVEVVWKDSTSPVVVTAFPFACGN